VSGRKRKERTRAPETDVPADPDVDFGLEDPAEEEYLRYVIFESED